MAPRKKKVSKKLQIVPLGGVMEIGKNMTAYVYGDQIIVVDAGLMFPDEDMLGVDIVIPDITFLEENKDKVLGIVLTHGHEDHIGAIPYVLKRLDVPVWGAPLAIGFVANKLGEHGLSGVARLYEVDTNETLVLGDFKIEYVRVAHSIPDAFGLIIHTPVGTIVQTGDFKFEQTPIDGQRVDISRLARAGDEGVLITLVDVTNVEKTGFTPSESIVGEAFDKIFATAPGRIIVAAFASNIHRVQRVYNMAAKHGRRVVVIGRSMVANCKIAENLGHLKVPEGVRLTTGELDGLDPKEVVIVTTGSQGEPLSALSKMASEEHKQVKITEGDTVVISATPIPGNEDAVMRSINRLFKQGADVVYEPLMKVHVSGHGNQEDIKLMLSLLKPKYIIPVHGEQRHYAKSVVLAESMGYTRDHVFKMTPGDVLEIDDTSAEITGRVASGSVMVDGLGVGDVEDVVLRDRSHLAQDGIVIVVVGIDMNAKQVVSGPDVFSRGFMGEDHGEDLTEQSKELVLAKISEFVESDSLDEIDEIKAGLRKVLAKSIYERTHRRPMIVPIVMEV